MNAVNIAIGFVNTEKSALIQILRKNNRYDLEFYNGCYILTCPHPTSNSGAYVTTEQV